MRMIFSVGLLAIPIFLWSGTKPAPTKPSSSKPAATFKITKQECLLPEGLELKAKIGGSFEFLVTVQLINKTDTAWFLDLKSSSIATVTGDWVSNLLDNHAGKPSNSRMPFDMERSGIAVLVPEALLEETDEDYWHTEWFQWPGKDNEIYNLVLAIVNAKGEQFLCHFSGPMTLTAKK